jgi:hypothetical protein
MLDLTVDEVIDFLEATNDCLLLIAQCGPKVVNRPGCSRDFLAS